MKKSLGRVTGAVLASALITFAVSPVAMAQEAPADTPTAPTSTTEPTNEAPAPTKTPTSDAPAPTVTDTAAPTKPSEPTKSVTPSTMPTHPATITEYPLPTEADNYVDDWAYGIDFPLTEGADGALIIACAAGQPKNVFSADIDLAIPGSDNPYQDEGDGRYWDYYVKRHPGHSFDNQTIVVGWDCGGRHIQKPIPPAGGGASGGKPGSQVKVTPKRGVETGGGATARF